MRTGIVRRAMFTALLLGLGLAPAIAHEAFTPNPDPAAAPPYQPTRSDILNEGFEGSWPPAGWAVIHLGTSFTWQRVSNYVHTGQYAARMHYGPQGVLQDEYLVTPALDFSSLEAAYLEFHEAQQYWEGFGEHHYIAVSTTSQTDPSAFTMLVDWTPANHVIDGILDFAGADDPTTVALHAYIGEPVVYLAFRFYGEYADDWYVDDVRVYEPFNHDVAVQSVMPDGIQFTEGGAITPSVEVENIGRSAEDIELLVTIEESGAPVYSQVLPIHLELGDLQTVNLPTLYAQAGNYYRLHAEAQLVSDESPANNVRDASCDSYSQPHVPLGWFHTNSGCSVCTTPEFAFDAWLPSQGSSVALIRCHTWWPNGADIMYLQNAAQNQQLIYQYDGADFTPHFWVDGTVDLGYDYSTYQGVFAARKDVLSPGAIDLHWRAADSTLVVSLDLVEPLDPAGDHRLHVAVTEDSIYSVGGNGHNLHSQALRRVFPYDLSGIPVDPEPGVQTFTQHISPESFWVGPRLNATVFLQEQASRRIWQARTARLNSLKGLLSLDPVDCEMNVGEVCSLRVMIAASQVPVKGVDVTIDFDESVAALQAVHAGSWVTGSGLQSYFHDYTETGATEAHFSLAFLNGTVTGGGELALLEFRGLAVGASALTFTQDRVRDANNTELDYSTSLGDSLFVFSDLTPVEEPPVAPTALRLLGNTPNPFNPSTLISYELPAAGRWQVAIYDAQGRLQRTLADEWQLAGRRELRWDGRDDAGAALGSGLYLVRVSGPTGRASGKLLLLK